ncbi:NUDIX hydrolase [Fictibacillus phosphorivorans]|uniref:NUDIX hydrolase n=1 Tax=Fictibacillus phosphorivorans TaxID=1221500 RepID=UPI00203F65FC|nr:NUDIX hydrolase [Fictibacillus phosphorivorans]MCM3718143.1 NUDIX hydrolase [Fictibacillus phosphorivorans]MCM3775770.1 NUDIX hydrolase [Fictibacillus phosphorivorans]
MAMPTHIVAVGAWVEDDQGNILLVKTQRGSWEFPGGQVENGESLMDAVVRETKEESGIEVEVSHLSGVYSNTCEYIGNDGVTHIPTKVMFDFVCKPVGGELAIQEGETTDSRWVPIEHVLDFVKNEAIRARCQDFLKKNESVHYKDYVTKPEFKLKLERTV